MKTSLGGKTTILLGSTMVLLMGAGMSPALPALKRNFAHVPDIDFHLNLILTLPGLTLALFAPMIGWLLDRFGRKPILLLSLSAFGLIGASGVIWENFYMILLSRALLGPAAAGIIVGFTALIGDYSETPEELHGFMGIQGAAIAFGSIAYMMIIGVLADIAWNYSFLPFFISLALVPLTAIFLQEPSPAPSSESTESSEHWPMTLLATNYTLAFVGMVAFFLIPLKIPFLLESLGESSGFRISLDLVLMTLVSAVLAFWYKPLKERYSFSAIYLLMFGFMTLGFVLIAKSNILWHALMGMCLVGIGMAFFGPHIATHLVERLDPRLRGRALGWQMSVVFFAQFISPVVFYYPLTLGISITFLIAGYLLFILSFLFMVTIMMRNNKG